MRTIKVTARTPDESDINYVHKGECETNEHAKSVCEGMYLQRLEDNLELCAALRAVYAIAGEDAQVRKIVEDALNKHGE